jgi:hypothetical protein
MRKKKKSKFESLIKKKWFRFLTIFIVVWVIIIFSLYHVLFDYTKPYHSPKKEDKYYLYDSSGKLDRPFGVTYKAYVDKLIDYYDSKLNDRQYHDDTSILYKLEDNQVVYVQKYMRDSNIAIVSLKKYSIQRKDSVMLKVYVPSVLLHKEPY